MFGEKAAALGEGDGWEKTRSISPILAPETAMRLWRMRIRVSRSMTTSWVRRRSKCSETEPARRILDGDGRGFD